VVSCRKGVWWFWLEWIVVLGFLFFSVGFGFGVFFGFLFLWLFGCEKYIKITSCC